MPADLLPIIHERVARPVEVVNIRVGNAHRPARTRCGREVPQARAAYGSAVTCKACRRGLAVWERHRAAGTGPWRDR